MIGFSGQKIRPTLYKFAVHCKIDKTHKETIVNRHKYSLDQAKLMIKQPYSPSLKRVSKAYTIPPNVRDLQNI